MAANADAGMRVTVLGDNNTLIGRYFLGEPGLCLLIEEGGRRILLDAGYSESVLENARRMDEDLSRLDAVVLSHGHLDHTWGLVALARLFTQRSAEGLPWSPPELVAHPDVFQAKRSAKYPQMGSLLSGEALTGFFAPRLSREPVWLTERLVFLGEIPRELDFEPFEPLGELPGPDGARPDPVRDDSALAWRGPDGLVVVSGCAHSGICNTVRRAQAVCGEQRVVDVVGGTHLLKAKPERLEATAAFMASLGLARMHPCHCTDLAAKLALGRAVPLGEVGVGVRLEYR